MDVFPDCGYFFLTPQVGNGIVSLEQNVIDSVRSPGTYEFPLGYSCLIFF